MAAYQKYFDTETVKDYDLIEMLRDASEKVTTQKILLVAHSQGNFYANSFYDLVAGRAGGAPPEISVLTLSQLQPPWWPAEGNGSLLILIW